MTEKISAILQIKQGIQYVAVKPVVVVMMFGLFFVSVFGFGLMTLMPVWAVSILGGNVTTNGFLLSARGTGRAYRGAYRGCPGSPAGEGQDLDCGQLYPSFDVFHFFLYSDYTPFAPAFGRDWLGIDGHGEHLQCDGTGGGAG